MALFHKKPDVQSSAPLYTLGLNTTLLVVGLGNVGKEYDKTRHNVGFTCVDAFADNQEFDGWIEKKDLKSFITSKSLADHRVILCKPTTMMNLSGEALQKVLSFYKIQTENLIVVHDELDLAFGQIRVKNGGGSAGNNGIKSIIQHVGEDFQRIRIGIGNDTSAQAKGANFVLGKFTSEELESIPQLIRETNSLLSEYVFSAGKLPPETRTFLI